MNLRETKKIPQRGEPWFPVGAKTTFLALHLFRRRDAAPFVPYGLRIVSPLPGWTLGGVLLSCYGPGSTLEYHELIVMPALVAYGRALGFWTSHLYVDSEASRIGGRRIGLPKELAQFEWQDSLPGEAHIFRAGQRIGSLHFSPRFGALRFWAGAPAMARVGADVIHFRNLLSARFGLCRVRYTIPDDSPLAVVRPGPFLVALAGTEMYGVMAGSQCVLGRLPLPPGEGAD